MKKLLALLLAMVMVLGMVACGGAEASAPAESVSAAAPAEDAPAAEGEGPVADDNAVAAEGSAVEAPAEEAVPESIECEPLNIVFNTTFTEAELGGQFIKHFEETLNTLTNGAITLEVFWGGTVFTDTEQLDALSSGAINMAAFGHMPHTATLNYLGFPGFAPGGTQTALDYFNEILFENPETSALVQQEAADNGIIYLNVVAGGANAFCASYEYTDLDSYIAASKSFGNMDPAIYEALGFQVSVVFPPDVYDALQRGLIDSTQMGFAPMVSMSWQDVASYWTLDGTYAAGNMFTANLDWWNSLSDAQRQAIQIACDSVETFSAGLYDDAIADDIAKVEAATGNKFVEFGEADIQRIWAATFEAKAAAAMETAELNGKTEGMTKILEVAAEFTGYNWEH